MSVGSRARTQMVHRAYIERNATATTNAYGHPEAASFAALSTTPCRFWSPRRRELVDGKKTVLIEQLRCAMPLDTDVTELDRIATIRDRQAAVILTGPFRIDAIQYKHTHLEMDLRRIEAQRTE